MLARRRGAARGRGKKMAKKGVATALQTDVTTDEEWLNILERPGLVLVDVYCDWSGPCVGMVSILKKIKMEMGGDTLSYATAKCDNIKSLARFRGKSEPAWMFVRGGKMINILFGANCPELTDTLIRELKRVQKDEPPDFSIPVYQVCEKEAERTRLFLEAKKAREAEANAKIEAKARAKYEARLEHYMTALEHETLIIFFPWIFRDEEGNVRDKKASPAYMEVIEHIFPQKFSVEQEIKKHLNDADIDELQKETDYELCPETRRHLSDGKSMILRLKMTKEPPDEMTMDTVLLELLFNEPRLPDSPDSVVEDSYVHRFMPPLQGFIREEESVESVSEVLVSLTTVWVPTNPRNKALAFKHLFSKYVDQTYPYAEEEDDTPLCLFKYDYTKKKEVQIALETYSKDVVNFGIFERDKLPDPKYITKFIERFEIDYKEKTGYEVFVAVVKKDNPEAFLTFAGIGPYHVSETPELALEEAEQFFPKDVEQEGLPADDDNQGDEYEDYEGEGFEEDDNEGEASP